MNPTNDTNQPTAQPADFLKFSVVPKNEPSEQSLETNAKVQSQLPFIDTLCQRFEDATGWEVDFLTPESCANETVTGQLEITDMSQHVPAGKSAAHRQKCDELVHVIDQMIGIIQDDHRILHSDTQRLEPVVNVPFDWWTLNGQSGYCRGEIAGWGISSQESIRLFAGCFNSDSPNSSPSPSLPNPSLPNPSLIGNTTAAVTALATWDVCARGAGSLADCEQLVEHAITKYSSETDTEAAAFIEVDPITGSFNIHGHKVGESVLLVDVQARSIVQIRETIGTLVHGEVLIVGPHVREMTGKIDSILRRHEMTADGFVSRVQRLIADQPCMVLTRK